MIVTTMNDIPGYEVDEVFGEVMGLTVRSRNIGSQLGAGLKSIVGGELKGMTKALTESRQQVMERMVEEAEAKGANAIIAMRFDTSEMGGELDGDLRLRHRGARAQGLTRAVVFDLFETLVDYDDTRSREFSAEVAAPLRSRAGGVSSRLARGTAAFARPARWRRISPRSGSRRLRCTTFSNCAVHVRVRCSASRARESSRLWGSCAARDSNRSDHRVQRRRGRRLARDAVRRPLRCRGLLVLVWASQARPEDLSSRRSTSSASSPSERDLRRRRRQRRARGRGASRDARDPDPPTRRGAGLAECATGRGRESPRFGRSLVRLAPGTNCR